jgi:hypothetical protein
MSSNTIQMNKLLQESGTAQQKTSQLIGESYAFVSPQDIIVYTKLNCT